MDVIDKKRKVHSQRWDVAHKLSDNDFWEMIRAIYKSKEKEFSFQHIAELTYQNESDFVNCVLTTAIKHHIFIAVQYSPTFKNQKRKKYPKRNIQDRKGSIMSSCREQHERMTGENLPLLHWESTAIEKMKIEAETGIRHFIRRYDTALGLELDNIYLKPVKNGKRKHPSDFL